MLKEIYLRDFRNYGEARISLDPGVTIFYGDNGQGKTNLLEAVYFALRGRGFRTAGNRDLTREGAETGVVMVRLEEGGTERTVARQVLKDGSTRIKINGKEARAGVGRAVIFSQDDLALIKGEPQKRRDFVDEVAGEVEREFEERNAQFKKALHQRNETLKRIRRGEGGRGALAAWEEILADRGEYIVSRRRALLQKLEAGVNRLTGPAAEGELSVRYYGTFDGKEDYLERLARNREREIARGITVIGPHRDEMVFLLNGRNLRTRGSQGQQRKAVVLLKLACAELYAGRDGDRCLLLLDDLPSELDAHNTGWLMGLLRGKGQTLITINTNRLQELAGEGRRLRIEEGKVI